jgi:hypothetical protein
VKKLTIISVVFFVIAMLVYFSGVRERSKLKNFFVGNSCDTDAMTEFRRATASEDLDGKGRADIMLGLFSRFMQEGKENNFFKVMDLPKGKQVAWVNAVTHDIGDRCPARVERDLDLGCYVATMVSFSNPASQSINQIMGSEAREKDLFKGLCILK